MKRLLALALVVLMLQGCGEKEFKPREIVADTDVCKICNMSIVHDEYTGQVALTDGDYEVFDDLGCLVQFVATLDEGEIGAGFIKDANTNEWIKVDQATFVYHKDFWTPMSYGVLAFSTEETAKKWIDTEGKGELLTSEELAAHEWGVHK